MKKLLVALVAMFAVTAASAQISNVGLRVNGGIEIVGQYDMGKANYIDGRIGFGNDNVSLTGIYNWKLKNFNWTPSIGKWFFDAGVGGGAYTYDKVNKNNNNISNGIGACIVGQVKLGIKLNDAPVSIAWDFCPAIDIIGDQDNWFGGVSIVYHF